MAKSLDLTDSIGHMGIYEAPIGRFNVQIVSGGPEGFRFKILEVLEWGGDFFPPDQGDIFGSDVHMDPKVNTKFELKQAA